MRHLRRAEGGNDWCAQFVHAALAGQAIRLVDIPIIIGVSLVAAVAIALGNLLPDVAAPFIDPRIKLR